jgi:3',5'-cyclic-AMP phosphodiesterase
MRHLIICLGLIFFFSNCKSLHNTDANENFRIMMLADTQTSDDEEKYQRLEDLIDKVNQKEFPEVDFVMVAGDFVSAVYGDNINSESRLERTVGIFNKLSIPYYAAMGNHDYKLTRHVDSDADFSKNDIENMEKIWKDHIGFEPYYAFEHKGWNFIVLNSMRGRYLKRAFDDKQIKWFESELKKDLPTILTFHHPIQTDNDNIWAKPKDIITEQLEPEFFRLCKTYKDQIKGIFVGHGHRWVHDKLFDTIEVQETEGFADSKNQPFTIIDFDNSKSTIQISKYPKIESQRMFDED